MTPVAIEKLPPKLRDDAERFLKRNARTPAARLRPHIGISGSTWMAMIGKSVQHGLVGFGHTPRRALHAFNRICAERGHTIPG